MSITVFKPHSAKAKHGSIAVDGYCYRYSRTNVSRYSEEYRCCDDRCQARVLFNSTTDFRVTGDHSTCAFDHQRELRSRTRIDVACEILEKNLTDPPQKIIEKVQDRVSMTPEEKQALRMFVVRKRSEVLGEQRQGGGPLTIPAYLRVTATPISPEHPDNSFLLFDSDENDENAPSRILIFASADMRFKASLATELFADGTYRIVPNGFATLYTIHSIVGGVPYPIFFCLMENEREETFMRVLAVTKRYLTKFGENGIVRTDCQRSVINAFQRSFGCGVKVCLFHINQALWRYVSKIGLATAYNNTKKPRLHAWIRRLMAFPFTKPERMTACFHDCFEVMAFDDVLGVEPEFHKQFRTIIAYYKRFWLEEIGPGMICQWDEANRTNNHSEAFHRGIGRAVQVAHPQTLVLIQLLVNIERDAMLRFDDQRAGKAVKRHDKRLDELEASIASVTRSYDDGLFRNDSEYLSAIAKLYVEYNHMIKTARVRNNTAHVCRSASVKTAIMKALDGQNTVLFGEAPMDCTTEDGSIFVEADFNSEIVFDAIPMECEEQENVVCTVKCQGHQESDIPMEICSNEAVSEKRRQETKQRVCSGTMGTQARRRRRTLLQRMRGKR